MKVDVNPVTIIDREIPVRASTMDAIKNTAKSVLSRGFSSDRRSVKNKNPPPKKDEVKDSGSGPIPILTRKTR